MSDHIGLDTNVALRWLVAGTDDQGQIASTEVEISARSGTIHINHVVLAEIIWLLSHALKFDRSAQAKAIGGMLGNPSVKLADHDAVAAALVAFETGGAGFTDHLIGELNRRAGCSTTLTFDKTAARSPNFTLLS